MNVQNVFLHGALDKEIFELLSSSYDWWWDSIECQLNKLLYRLKQKKKNVFLYTHLKIITKWNPKNGDSSFMYSQLKSSIWLAKGNIFN